VTGEGRLAPIDSMFLKLEDRGYPMHMASIARFEGGPLRDGRGDLRLDELRALISSRLPLVSKLRQLPSPGVLPEAPPAWTDDTAFDIANHVIERRIPRPSTEADLLALCGEILAAPLPRDKPLWQLIFIDGLEDGDIAVVEKLHHSMADGIAAAELAIVLLDASPEPHPIENASAAWRPDTPAPVVYGAAHDLLRAGDLSLRCAAWGLWTVLHPVRRSRVWITKVNALASVVRGGLIAPHSTPTGDIGPERGVHVIRLDLEEVRHIAHAHGATINDLVLTLVSHGLHCLLTSRNDLDPETAVQALVPVGLEAGPGRGIANRVSAFFVRLPVGTSDPRTSLDAIAAVSKDHKEQHQELAGDSMLRLLEPVPQGVLGFFAKVVQHQPFFNIIVTNVPGPRAPLYALGAQMREAFPIVPLVGNQGLGVAALSYLDQINLGILSDPATYPNVDVFCDGVRTALGILRGDTEF
jgi:diacylglycerol O-acyltransferase / wax synthase